MKLKLSKTTRECRGCGDDTHTVVWINFSAWHGDLDTQFCRSCSKENAKEDEDRICYDAIINQIPWDGTFTPYIGSTADVGQHIRDQPDSE